jgi:hypothetical protein
MPARTLIVLLLLANPEPPRVFNNDDLDRLAPYRGQTGGSAPSREFDRPPAREKTDAAASKTTSREPYWRAEARRVRQRMQAHEDRAVVLRQQIEERRAKPGVSPYSDPQIRRLQDSADLQLSRSRELEADLLDRARREGALPGWVR